MTIALSQAENLLRDSGPAANGNYYGHLAIAAPEESSGGVPPWACLLWEHRRFLARVLAFGLVASLMTALLIPARYDSTIRLMPPDSQSGSALTMLSALAGKSGLGTGSLPQGVLGLRSSGALFVDILGSRTIEDQIVGRFDLRKEYGERFWVNARKRLQNYTDISEDRKSEVITIRVTDRDPQRAALMAQAYVDELDHLVAQVSTSSARRERIFIGDRLLDVKLELDRASREFSQFASQNATMDITSQGREALEAAARLQGELIAGQSELEGLEQVYTTNNFRVRAQLARVNEFKRQLDRLDGDHPQPPPGSVSTSGDKLSGTASNAFPSIRQIPLLGVRWVELYRQTKMEETVYELLTQQYEMAKIEEAKEIPTVKILDAADVPEKKSFPPRLVILIIGTLLAFTGGALWVVGTEAWNQINPQDFRKRIGRDLLQSLKTLCHRWLAKGCSLLRKERTA